MPERDLPKPYKGPESFQPEDATLFFGREKEADQIVAKIISSRLTLLHAQSGAGKTSLLNARIIPELECRNSIPIRVLPLNDPVESIRLATLQALFPPISVEREAIQNAQLALGADNEDLMVSELLARYDQLSERDPLFRQLVKRRKASKSEGSATLPEGIEYEPFFSRTLRGGLKLPHFLEHIRALKSLSGGEEYDHLPSGEEDRRIRDILNEFDAIEQNRGYRHIINLCYPPVPDLYTFFDTIASLYGSRRSKFGIILILDQFEEIFTRFVDPGTIGPELPQQPLDWRLRWELFDQLADLYDGGAERKPLPIRYVVSLRDEYIAQLDPLRKFVPDLDNCTYHLTLLTIEEAKLAVSEPARKFGYVYSDECFHQIIAQLTKEGRFVEPTHLQIVCETLWNYRGRQLSEQPGGDASDLPTLEARELATLDGAAGILRSFFRKVLDELGAEDSRRRVEALEMLELLVTSSGTRNIVERHDLTHPKFRKAPLREYLLSRLERSTIVRIESRLGGQFAEITHEFLIAPILEALRKELISNPDYSRIRYGIRLMSTFEGTEFRGANGRLLDEREFATLHQLRNTILWEGWSLELMLRSAVALGVPKLELDVWITAYQELPFVLEESVSNLRDGRPLTLQELYSLAELSTPLSRDVERRAVESTLELAADHERDLIIKFIGRMVEHG